MLSYKKAPFRVQEHGALTTYKILQIKPPIAVAVT